MPGLQRAQKRADALFGREDPQALEAAEASARATAEALRAKNEAAEERARLAATSALEARHEAMRLQLERIAQCQAPTSGPRRQTGI